MRDSKSTHVYQGIQGFLKNVKDDPPGRRYERVRRESELPDSIWRGALPRISTTHDNMGIIRRQQLGFHHDPDPFSPGHEGKFVARPWTAGSWAGLCRGASSGESGRTPDAPAGTTLWRVFVSVYRYWIRMSTGGAVHMGLLYGCTLQQRRTQQRRQLNVYWYGAGIVKYAGTRGCCAFQWVSDACVPAISGRARPGPKNLEGVATWLWASNRRHARYAKMPQSSDKGHKGPPHKRTPPCGAESGVTWAFV